MIPMSLHPSRSAPFRSASAACLLALLNLLVALRSYAQVADVVKPAPDGDFPTIAISGYRGTYPQLYWLVVDRDPRGLLCRDEQGRAHIALKYGSLIETDLAASSTSPLTSLQGKSYLRVRVQSIGFLHDARLRQRKTSTACSVRANTSFIAPVNADSIGLLCRAGRMGEVRPAPDCSMRSPSRREASYGITP